VAGLVTAFGSGAMTNSIPEFEEYTDCFLITGSNTSEAHPLIFTRILRARKRGARIIVVDPRDIQIAKIADIHLRQRPGTDVAWLNGMMHVLIEEGLYDKEFVAERTEGFEELKAAVAEYTPQRVEGITGIPAADLAEAARVYARAERGAILYAMGITQHTTGVDNVVSCANLAMLTGNVGKEGTGVNPLRGQNNVQGACDLGGLPNVYSGYQAVTVEAVRDKFQEAWGGAGPLRVGLTVTEMMDAAHGGAIKALYVMGENPMVSDPDLNHAREALAHCEFLVVQDIFPTETVEFADVVLPGVTFAEKDGTFTNTDRRIQLVRQAIPPLGDSRADWAIIAEVAQRMTATRNTQHATRFSGWQYDSPAQIMDEIAALTPIYGGASFARLEQAGQLQWPVPTADHPGTPFLHKGKFSRGLGHFSAVPFKEPAEAPDEEYPLTLTTGRIMFHYHTGSMTRRSEKLDREVPEGYVEINPEDADRLGLGKHGVSGVEPSAPVRVISRRGEIETRAWITRRVPPGVVFIPFHFAEAAANVLTNPALDPIAKIPEYKVGAVRIEKVA
jgi:formate dehydrogenase alpha subunit